MLIRKIKQTDNQHLAKIVKDSLLEFDAAKPGTAYFDAETDALFELFQKEKAHYFVAEVNGKILGGGGIFPTNGLPDDTCELVKVYLAPEARGIGIGKEIIKSCFEKAKNLGFNKMYLESLLELSPALKIYEKIGFKYLKQPLGNSGHTACNVWMLKNLN